MPHDPGLPSPASLPLDPDPAVAAPRPERLRAGWRATLHAAWRWGAFPGLLIGAVTASGLLRRHGLDDTVAVVLVTGAVALLLLAAQLLSRERRPALAWFGTDVLHLLLSNGLAQGLARAALLGLVLRGAAALEALSGGRLWPDALPLAAQVALAMVLGELFFTLAHRAMHELPWLWPVHAVHHSSTQLYVLSAARSHPINAVLSYLAQVFPALLLGAPAEVLVPLSVFTTTLGMLQHCDLDLRTGWLGWVFATPEVHRIHHSARLPEGNTNYGSNLVLWDHLLGTFTPPRHRPVHVGIADVEVPDGYWRQLATPFRYRRLRAR